MQFKIFRALGLSFKAWFRNFVPFTALTALLYAPVMIWVGTIDVSEASSLDDLLQRVYVWPLYAVTALATLLAPMLTYRVIQELNGTRVSLFQSIRFGVRGFLPALVLAIATNVLGLIPGGGIVAAILMCIWFVAAPSAVAEQLSVGAALSRSAELTKGRRWGIFGLVFLMGILVAVMMMIWIIPMFRDEPDAALASLKSSSFIFIGIMGLFQMFTGIVEAVSYALLRQDKEGITHEQLAKVFE